VRSGLRTGTRGDDKRCVRAAHGSRHWEPRRGSERNKESTTTDAPAHAKHI
jgi:hypothetical protein